MFCISFIMFAQHGNEWIDYSQTYYKFPITQTGVYRITYADLNNAGFPISSTDPRNIQIFGHESEVTLKIEGESDGVFDAADYIEFYAEKSNGRLDSLLFVNSEDHANKQYNYFSDTIYYFITTNSSTSNKRYTESNSSNYASFTPKSYVYRSIEYSPATNYRQGHWILGSGGNNISDPRYVAGEGYFDGFITAGNTFTFSRPLTNTYLISGGPTARVHSVSSTQGHYTTSGENRQNHVRISHSTASGTNSVKFDQTYTGVQVDKLNFAIDNSDLIAGNMSFNYSLINDTGADQDYYSFAEIEINYPHTNSFENKSYFEFNFPSDENATTIRIDAVNVAGTNNRVLNISNGRLIYPEIVSTTNHYVLPNEVGSKTKYVCYADQSLKSVSSISLATQSGQFTDFFTDLSTNNFIIITHRSLLNEVLDYKSYRESNQGGSYNVILADVEEIYDQFGEGVPLSGLSIRRFLKGIIDLAPEYPKGVFTIGKGIHNGIHIKSGSWGTRRGAQSKLDCLIPVLGEPATDNMFTVGLNGDWNHIDLPIGRYAAQTPSDVALYLEKVQEYELNQVPIGLTVEDKEWQKNILHFIVGSSNSEQTKFLGFTNEAAQYIEQPFYGANVENYLKDGNVAIDPTALALLQQKIEAGVSIVQFFGHSSYTNGFDTNLDKPENWNNQGRYPLVIANGCNSGDLYKESNVVSNSEDFVIIEDEGAIAYISTTATGFDIPLKDLTREFYKELSINNYNNTIGSSFSIAASRQLQLYDNWNVGDKEKFTGSVLPTTIHGDPLLKTNTYLKPEFIIPNDGISFSPGQPTLQDTELTVSVKVYNVGQSVADTISVELVRTFPNGVDSVYNIDITGVKSYNEVQFKIPINHSFAGGLNQFEASVDIPSNVEELEDEYINNVSRTSLIIFTGGVIPLLPYEFAIVPDSTFDMYAATYDPSLGNKNYLIEIDTTDEFNTNWKKHQEVTSQGGSIKLFKENWINSNNNIQNTIRFEDSTVYFWRTSEVGEDNWEESSFQYIKTRVGWEQAHFFQFKNDEYQTLIYDKPNRKFEFDTDNVRVRAEMFSNASTGAQLSSNSYYIFNTRKDYGAGGQLSPSIHISVIDPDTYIPWGTPKNMDYDNDGIIDELLNPTHFFGQFNEYGQPWRKWPDTQFTYQQFDQTQLQSIQSLINAVPDGFYILVYVYKSTQYANWDALHPGLYGEFQALGADQIISGQQENLFSFLAKKGDPSFTQQYYSDPIGTTKELHVFEAEFPANGFGVIDAPLAGPTNKWNTIYWQQNPLETPTADSSRLFIYGNNGLGSESLLLDTLMSTKDSIINLYSLIDADLYPYLRLKAFTIDKVTATPAQFNRWQIMYEPVPEASVEPKMGLYYTAKNGEVQEGEDVSFAVAFKNISQVDMDSVMIKYWLEDQDHNEHVLKYEKVDSLRIDQIIMDTIHFNTLGFGGENTIWLEINTISNVTGRPEQLEQYHFNNFFQTRLYVQEDDENPLVDVTFDGVHIFDGDIVSPSPNILIKLKDENLVRLLNEDTDTSLFRVTMVYPDEIFEKQIYFKNGNGETVMQWYPASGKENTFTIEYNPTNLPDGLYTLKVQGADKSNNLSGDLTYDVEFEVINESTITHFYNYPNPFSTKTRFVFTLTGSEIPDDIYIQILTITGKVVKQITQDDLGTIHIGKNVTDYYWDGTDDFGDVLANGVYLYRVVTKINGEEIKHRETSADYVFKKNYGKLYIMR